MQVKSSFFVPHFHFPLQIYLLKLMVTRIQENEDPLVALKEALDKHGKFEKAEGLIVFDDLCHLRTIALR